MSDSPPTKAPYGDVPYADPGYQKDGKKRYPIDTKEHARAAWDYINKGANQEPYTSDQVASIKDKIQAAAKKFGINIDDGDGDAGDKKQPAMAGTKSAPADDYERLREHSKAIEAYVLAGFTYESVLDAIKRDDPSLVVHTGKFMTSTIDAVREDTSVAGRNTPEDAAPKGTSTGHANNAIRKVVPKVKTLAELRVRLAEVEARMIEIGEETRDAELDAETQTEWDAISGEAEKVRASIKGIEARAEALKGMAVSNPGAVEKSTPAFHKKQDDIYDVQAVRMAADSPEDFSRRLRDNAMRAIEGAKYSIPRSISATKEDAQAHAERLIEEVDNESGDLAKRMLLTGSAEYERAFSKVLRHGSDVMCTQEERQALLRSTGGQTLGTSGTGGFAVPFQLDPTVILNNAGTTNPIRQLARVEQIVGKQWQGVTSAGVTAVRSAEGTTAPDNTFDLAQPVVSTNRVQGFVPFNIEIDLAWGALRTEITTLLVDAKMREEDSFITGDGVTGTQPGGVVGSLSANTVTAGGVASFSANDVYALQTALDPRWEDGSSFLAHKGIYYKVRQFDTAGGAQLWAQIGDSTPDGLMGYPAAKASAMDSVLTTGKKILLYGNFKQFLIVDRIGMNVELVPHLFDVTSGRPTGQRGVYAIWMNNSVILNSSAFKLLVTG